MSAAKRQTKLDYDLGFTKIKKEVGGIFCHFNFIEAIKNHYSKSRLKKRRIMREMSPQAFY